MGGRKKNPHNHHLLCCFHFSILFFLILNSPFLNYREERNKVAKEWLLSIGKIHSQCHSMKIFPLRADLEIFFFPLLPCREMASEMPPQALGKHQMQKKQNSLTGLGGLVDGKKNHLGDTPCAAKFSQIKQLPGVFPTFPESSFPASLHSAFPNLQNLSVFLQAQIYFLLNVKKKKKKMPGAGPRGDTGCIYSFQLPDFFLRYIFRKCSNSPGVSPCIFPCSTVTSEILYK